jgi:hypothetical protein
MTIDSDKKGGEKSIARSRIPILPPRAKKTGEQTPQSLAKTLILFYREKATMVAR